MSSVQDAVKRDGILFEHVCPWGVTFDSDCGKFVFQCKVDGLSFTTVEEKITEAGLDFSHDCFNTFVAVAQGRRNEHCLNFESGLHEDCLLPGEILILNDGYSDMLGLLKISVGNYLIVKSEDPSILLRTASCGAHAEFFVGVSVWFELLGEYKIKRVDIMPPSRVARALDYTNGQLYARSLVAKDISELIPLTMQPLSERCFDRVFMNLAKEYASSGVSSWALQVIADAYAKKYMV